MKEHMSITLEKSIAARLRQRAQRERRAVSQVVEMAIEKLLDGQGAVPTTEIVTTQATFKGVFSRQDAYGDR